MSDSEHSEETGFRREITPDRRNRAVVVEEQATAEERAAVAAFLDLVSLDRLILRGTLRSHGREGWRFDGEIEAALAQRCVATLEPAPAAIREPLSRIWLPQAELEAARAADPETIDPLEDSRDEDPEPLPERIDLGAAAVETLALALDPWPRAPGVEFTPVIVGPPGVEPLTDEAARPFAGLAALTAREGDDPAPERAADGDRADTKEDPDAP